MLANARRSWAALDAAGRRELLVFVLLLFAYGYFQQRPAWNELSRYDLTRAIVEQGTLRIDSFHENTGDKAFYGGHWYSDKAPGTALLGVPVYALLLLTSSLTGGGPPDQVEAVQALAFIESAIPTALVVVLLLRLLRPLAGERWALVVALGFGLASMAFPFATMFFGHAASTAALFGAFYLLSAVRARAMNHATGGGGRLALLAGFLAGWAVLIEIPVVLGVAALAGYALFIGRGIALRFVAGGLPLAGVLLAYNWAAFENPLSLGYQHTTVFAEQNAQGLVSIVWPTLDRAGEILFDERGLLRLAPWLALAPLGLVALRGRAFRFEIVLAAVICAAFLTYNSGALNPFGGWTPGPRYLMPALPFAALLVAFIPARLRVVAIGLMLLAAGIFFVATATMPNAPERFDDPLAELWLPRFLGGAVAETIAWLRWGLPGLAAIAVLLLGLGFGAVALAMSFGRAEVASRVSARAPAALAVLALALSFPFPPPRPIGLASAGDPGRPQVSIAEAGHVELRVDGHEEVELWASIENRGASIASGRAHFRVWRLNGEGVWSAWYGEVVVDAGTRRTFRITWRPGDEPPGLYRYGFAMEDETTGAVYVEVEAIGRAAVGG